MKYLNCNVLSLVIVLLASAGCFSDAQEDEVGLIYKKALLRTKNVYSIGHNIDKNNELNISFITDFDYQLAELSISTRPMMTSDYTILNANGSIAEEVAKTDGFYGEIDILLNGTSIYSCLVEQCQEIKCSSSEENSLTGEFESNRIHLNLNKTTLGLCSASLNIGANSLKVIHLDDEQGPEFQGRYVRAQVSVFNSTYTPQGMKNATN